MKIVKQIQAVLAAGLVISAATATHALSMIPANLGLIVEYTDKAFVGTAVSMQTVSTPQGWADEVTFTVTDPILGSVQAGDTVTWRQVRSGETVPLPGMPTYEAGKEYTIFLADKAPGSQLQAPYALGQGTFRVHRDKDSGAAYARNEFLNSALFQDMDTEALADAIVAGKSGTAKLSAGERAARVKNSHQKLHNLRGGAIDLETLKDAARTLKQSGAPQSAFARKGGSLPPRAAAPVR